MGAVTIPCPYRANIIPYMLFISEKVKYYTVKEILSE